MQNTARQTVPASSPATRGPLFSSQKPRPPSGGPPPQIEALERGIHEQGHWIEAVRHELGQVIVGQTALVERLLVALLAGGHVLLEGVPGLAKTLSLKTLAG